MGGCITLKKSKEDDDNRNTRIDRSPTIDSRSPIIYRHRQDDSGGSSNLSPRSANPVSSPINDNLLQVTNIWGANLLGQGGFGYVYKAYFTRLGQVVAVKQIYHNNRKSLERIAEFDTERKTLELTHHPNIVKLHGFCLRGSNRSLVYEYMPLRSLDLHLHDVVGAGRKALDWNTRMKIAAGVAQALEYIHTALNPPIIHRDVKSSHILLGENYQPKLSGFGFSIRGPIAHVTTMGTPGYSAPEHAISGHLTVKADIYSFGVLLLEILTGRIVNGQSLVDWARPLFKFSKRFGKMADPLMRKEFPKEGFKHVMCIVALCVHEDPEKRQEMSKIVPYLDYLANKPFPPVPLPTIVETSEHSGNSSTNSPSNTAQRELPSSTGNSSGDDVQLNRISNNMQGDQPSSSRNN